MAGAARKKQSRKPRRARGAGEGSIYKDKDGRWRASVTVGFKNGQRSRKLLSGRTRSEVAAKLTVELGKLQLGIATLPGRLTVGKYLSQWLENKKSTVSQKTFRTYTDLVEDHIAPALGRVALAKLSPQQVRSFMNEKLEAGLSARTVTHLRDTLRCALNVAVKESLMARNVAALAEPPRAKLKFEPRFLTPQEARDFIAAFAGHRLEALFCVVLCFPIREGEILGLRWPDLDLDNAVLRVHYQLQRDFETHKLALAETKTDPSRRTIRLPQIAVAALLKHRGRQDEERRKAGSRWKESGMVFTTGIGTPLDARNMLRSFYEVTRQPGSKVSTLRFHDLRHSAATLLLAQGVHPKVVQEIGGWTHIRTVLDTYSHVIPSLKHDAAAKMDEILRPVASSVASSARRAKVN